MSTTLGSGRSSTWSQGNACVFPGIDGVAGGRVDMASRYMDDFGVAGYRGFGRQPDTDGRRPCGSMRAWSAPRGSDEPQADQQGAAYDARRGQNPCLAELSAIERPDRQQCRG